MSSPRFRGLSIRQGWVCLQGIARFVCRAGADGQGGGRCNATRWLGWRGVSLRMACARLSSAPRRGGPSTEGDSAPGAGSVRRHFLPPASESCPPVSFRPEPPVAPGWLRSSGGSGMMYLFGGVAASQVSGLPGLSPGLRPSTRECQRPPLDELAASSPAPPPPLFVMKNLPRAGGYPSGVMDPHGRAPRHVGRGR